MNSHLWASLQLEDRCFPQCFLKSLLHLQRPCWSQPHLHIYNLINLCHTTKIKLLVSGLKCNLPPDKLRCASNTFPVRISNIENSYSDERRLNSERIKTQISNLKEEYEPVEASVPFSCIRKTHWACLRHSVIMSQHAPEVHSWHLDCLRCQTS